MKPSVLHLIDSFHQGGSERQALQLIRLLSESGRFNVRLACLSAEGSLRETIEDLTLGEIPSFPLTSFYDKNAVAQLRRFVRWVKASRIDILQTHDFYTNVFGVTSAAIARLPVRIASMRETEGMRSSAQKRLQRVSYSLSHHVIANSKAVRETLIKEGLDSEKVSVIYNGLDLRRLDTQASKSEILKLLRLPFAESDNVRFVSIVANMRHDVKDYPMFLHAAQQIKTQDDKVAFLLAGEGELEASLKSLSSTLGINDSTFFLGRCDKVAELLKLSDVCVLSSKAEGFSNSILEYMAAGRPVVATDVGGAREAISEGVTGYLVPSGESELMAQRVIGLLQEPELGQRMGSAGRSVVEEKFSVNANLSRTEELYELLLSKTKGARPPKTP